MNPIGSFYPLPGEFSQTPGVLFAYVLDTPDQQRALREETLARLTALSSLSDALLTMAVDDHDPRSHARLLDAIAILSRDAIGLVKAADRSID
jgi:hypothetical protein